MMHHRLRVSSTNQQLTTVRADAAAAAAALALACLLASGVEPEARIALLSVSLSLPPSVQHHRHHYLPPPLHLLSLSTILLVDLLRRSRPSPQTHYHTHDRPSRPPTTTPVAIRGPWSVIIVIVHLLLLARSNEGEEEEEEENKKGD
ncbi:uncharacterized protein IWZ02DRAFT_430348 [Phyllosticta citriasiana]|uniref:uncharacterized protein n=1 Tax=Phyllosticta citriasiana TaxID=595635 RepID=UPI0030FDE6FE